jgi:hexosaminidase
LPDDAALRAAPAWRPVLRLFAILAIVGVAACGDDDHPTRGPEFVPGSVDVVPLPADVEVDALGSVFMFDADTAVRVVRGEAESRAAAQLLVDLLRGPFPARESPSEVPHPRAPRNSVLLTTSGADPALGRDGYELEVTPQRVRLRAAAAPGFVHGVQTLRQLLPAEVELRAASPGVAWSVPSVRIRDLSRFPWRGLLIDTSRFFPSKAFVLRELDLLALYKISVLHLHLTDDQGWRVEIDSYPALHELGSQWDAEQAPNERGGYYTKDDLREIVARAGELGIEVVPEIDMPGHSVAALHAMPELACRDSDDEPRSADEFPIIPWTKRALSNAVLCVCDERVYDVLQTVLDEIIDLFPSQFVHVGGDEVTSLAEWEASPLCQQLIARGVVAGADHLQAYFEHRIEAYLRAHGRRMIAWDEALTSERPDLPAERLSDDAAFSFWRDFLSIPDRLYARDVVATPFTRLYFDYATSIERAYGFDPAPPTLTSDQAAHVLGAEAAMWTGFSTARSEPAIEQHIFPRVLALAELGWTTQAQRDFGDFSRRLAVQQRRLDMLGVAQGP